MIAARLRGGSASCKFSAFARASCNRLVPRSWPGRRVKMQASHLSEATYQGKPPGFRSPNIAARAVAQQGSASSAQLPPKPEKTKDQYCRMCGTQMQLTVPKGEAAWRHMCSSCGYIDYFNPKMVVGCIVEHEGKILLCKRAIDPCKGKWTLPAGYMELKESSAAGAARETWEEANCQVEILAPYSHFDIPVIGQAYILFRAKLAAPYTFSPGEETLQTTFFHPDDIPFDQWVFNLSRHQCAKINRPAGKRHANSNMHILFNLFCHSKSMLVTTLLPAEVKSPCSVQIAFSSISLALQYYVEDMHEGQYRVHHGVVAKQPGSGPNEAGQFQLQDHMAVQTAVPALGKL